MLQILFVIKEEALDNFERGTDICFDGHLATDGNVHF